MILAVALVLSCVVFAYGVFCAVAPKKAILQQSRWSTLVAASDADEPSRQAGVRVQGCGLMLISGFMILIVLGRLTRAPL
jgi:hypothetical protein